MINNGEYLPNFVLQDGVGLNVDSEGHLTELKVVYEPVRVFLLGQVKELQNEVTGCQNDLERLMVFLLSPRELTRLV